MASTSGRRVVVPMTNKSGGGVVAGDVVIIDSANNDSFTTTTSAGSTATVGVAQETIASNAVGKVCIGGKVDLVNVSASVTRGNYGSTHTVAKQAADVGARAPGTFCQFTTSGTTPAAIIYPTDLGGTALTNPMTTVGDIIIGGASGAPARLADIAAGYPLVSGGVGVAPAWGAMLAHGCRALRASGNFSVGNNVFTAVEFTAEDHDTDSMHDTGSNTSRITIPSLTGVTTGLWAIKASGYTNASSGRVDVMFRKNAGANPANGTYIGFVPENANTGGISGYKLSIDAVLSAADYVECFVRTTGGTFSVIYDTTGGPLFEAAFLGKVT